MYNSWYSDKLHEIFRDITWKSEKHELIRVISRTISCSISESPLHFIFFFNCVVYAVSHVPDEGVGGVGAEVLRCWIIQRAGEHRHVGRHRADTNINSSLKL